MKCLLRILPLIGILFGVLSSAESFTGKVVGITDGDTVRVMRNGAEVKVRLWGIDTPEKNQAYGTKAKQAISNMIFGLNVRVDIKDIDRYGRTVGAIFTESGTNVNAQMVRDGMAWWYKRYAPNERLFEKHHNEAKNARRGLWRDANPIAPWDFRANSRSGNSNQRTTTQQVQPQTQTVYVTKSGSKYHRGGCRYLSKGKIPKDLASAKRSYGACSVCRP